jgi:hypothetical protein
MKAIVRCLLVLLSLVSLAEMSHAQSETRKVVLRDEMGVRVNFILSNSTKSIRLTSYNGELEVDKIFMDLHKGEKWAIEFPERLAEIVYFKRLYKANDIKTQYAKSGDIQLEYIFVKPINDYYFQKQVRLLEGLEESTGVGK